MIIAIVIDPEAFNKGKFTEPHSDNALVLLRGLGENALMLVDSNKIMAYKFEENINRLPDKLIRETRIELEEILKNRKGCIVPCLDFNTTHGPDFITLYKNIKKSVKNQQLDAIIAGDNAQKKLCSAGISDNNVIPLKSYTKSNVEKKRRNYFKFSKPLDNISPDKAKELISRTLGYTKNLSFFDKYIGALKLKTGELKIEEKLSKKHIRKWFGGISYILTLWESNCHFEKVNNTIEIFTGELFFYNSNNENWSVFNQRYEKIRSEAKAFIDKHLINALYDKFPWCDKIKLYIKRDPKNIFRDRHLQTDNIIINYSKGFDFLKKNGGFKRIYLSVKPDAAPDLQDIRELEEIN